MSDHHQLPTRTFRPEPGAYTDAQGRLQARDRTVTDFLGACLSWLISDPDAALATLAPHWPKPRPYGRPRNPEQTDDGSADHGGAGHGSCHGS